MSTLSKLQREAKTTSDKRRALLKAIPCIYPTQNHDMHFLRLQSMTEIEIFYCSKCLLCVYANGEECIIP